MAKRGMVVSDLHLLAKRSMAEALLDEIEPQMECCDLLVLNGDTFDFRWSRLDSESASIAAAIEWMQVMMARFEGRELHFIYGNHDCLKAFREKLEPVAEETPHLQLHESHLRLGDQLFLHGDCSNRRMDVAAMHAFREGWSEDRPRGRFSALMYDFVDKTGLCGQFHRRYFPRERTVQRVAHYLDAALPDWRETVGDIYFGHTHLPFRDHDHEGVRFHNTGSGICGMGFHPIEFEFELGAAIAVS